MDERERLHRSDPARTGPIRDFSHLYRRPEVSPDDVSIEPAPAPPANGAGPQAQSVEEAYRIIHKHVDEGRQAAAQYSRSAGAGRNVSDPLQQLLDRVVNLQGEMLPLLLDAMRSLVQPSAKSPPSSQVHPRSSTTETSPQSHSIALDLLCRRPVEIAFELRDQCIEGPLGTPGLHALAGNRPPLRDVSFVPAGNNGHMTLRIVVPDDQESGVYCGVIVNQATGEVRGTVSVKLSD